MCVCKNIYIYIYIHICVYVKMYSRYTDESPERFGIHDSSNLVLLSCLARLSIRCTQAVLALSLIWCLTIPCFFTFHDYILGYGMIPTYLRTEIWIPFLLGLPSTSPCVAGPTSDNPATARAAWGTAAMAAWARETTAWKWCPSCLPPRNPEIMV